MSSKRKQAGANIYTTNLTGFSNASGTSFAAPHVAGVCALLKEARPSLTSRQIKAILINSSVFVSHPSGGGAGNGVWNAQGGWGALDAYNAVRWRNNLRDDSIGADQTKYYSIHSPSVGEPVVVTLVWHRAMADLDNPVAGSPGDLDLYLEGRDSGGNWVQVAASASGDLPGHPEVFDNVEQVYFLPTGSPTSYRVRVYRPAGLANYTENFTLAARRPFLSLGP